jgi:hypothetical protein
MLSLLAVLMTCVTLYNALLLLSIRRETRRLEEARDHLENVLLRIRLGRRGRR